VSGVRNRRVARSFWCRLFAGGRGPEGPLVGDPTGVAVGGARVRLGRFLLGGRLSYSASLSLGASLSRGATLLLGAGLLLSAVGVSAALAQPGAPVPIPLGGGVLGGAAIYVPNIPLSATAQANLAAQAIVNAGLGGGDGGGWQSQIFTRTARSSSPLTSRRPPRGAGWGRGSSGRTVPKTVAGRWVPALRSPGSRPMGV